jgi:hypothetical protein
VTSTPARVRPWDYTRSVGALKNVRADFFTTGVWTWRGLVTYDTVFVIDLASRRVQILGSTPHPEALFMQRIVRKLTMAEAGDSSDNSLPMLDLHTAKSILDVMRLKNRA